MTSIDRGRLMVCAGLLLVSGNAVADERAAREKADRQVIVKLAPGLAAEIAQALPARSLKLERGKGTAAVATFLDRHGVASLRPVHAGVVRELKRVGGTDRSRTESVRRRFAQRAARAASKVDPPALSHTYVLELESPDRRDAVLEALRRDTQVVWAEADRVRSTFFVPNDPYFHARGSWGQEHDDLYGLKNIGFPDMWEYVTGERVVVAVLDTGLDHTQVDISERVWINPREVAGNGMDDDGNGFVDDVRGWDFAHGDNDPLDRHGHGTHVAGTIAATGNNGSGIIGVAWRARIMTVQGLDDGGWGTDSGLAAGLVYAADNGAHVINNSWGGYGQSPVIGEAIAHAYGLGTVLVAAAGNSAMDALDFEPAGRPEVITVAAIDHLNRLAWFSNRGQKIDVGAPGVDILSLRAAGTEMGRIVDERYSVASGTSMAAPHVAGVAALVLSAQPGYTNEQVRQAIRSHAETFSDDGHDKSYGYGRLNAFAADPGALTHPLEARLLRPLPRAVVSGPIDVRAIARGPQFHSYVLEYGAGAFPTEWTIVTITNFTPANGGSIATFVATGTPEGPMTIRLTARNDIGQAFIDQVTVDVDYAAISSPAPPPLPAAAVVIKPGNVVPIHGRATGGQFRSFTLDWAREANPSSGWSQAGITLVSGGTQPVVDGALGSWNTTGTGQAGHYTIRLRVDDGGTMRESQTVVYLEPDLLAAGWPATVEGVFFGSSATVFDAARGRSIGVVTPVDWPGGSAINVFSPIGQRWLHSQIDIASSRVPASGNFGDAPGVELLVPVNNAGILVRSEQGATLLPSPSAEVSFLGSVAQLADLDQDGQLEAVTAASGVPWSSTPGSVLSWRRDGSSFAPGIAFSDTGAARWGTRAFLAGDFDGDGAAELLVKHGTPDGLGTVLRRHHANGRPLPFLETDLGELWELAAGDLDRDGSLEIVAAGLRNGTGYIDVFAADGRRRSGWPKSLGYPVSLALADVDGDGAVDIVAAEPDNLHVLRGNGAVLPGWPQRTDVIVGRIVVADIDGDSRVEVLAPVVVTASSLTQVLREAAERVPCADLSGCPRARIQAMAAAQATAAPTPSLRLTARSRSGALVRQWELPGHGGVPLLWGVTPTVADFDLDGRTDIAIAFDTTNRKGQWEWLGVVTVLATGAPHRPAPAAWPMVFADTHNSSIVEAPGRPTAMIAAPAVPAQYSAGETIPFSGTASDAEDGALPASAFTWRVTFHKGDTVTDVLGPLTGVTGGSFTVPTTGDASTDVFYRIHLTVRDSSGLSRATSRDVRPRVSNVVLRTYPPGFPVSLDGQPSRPSPLIFSSVVGQQRTIAASPAVSSGGGSWELQAWSDSGAASHTITVPASEVTLTATYRLVLPAPTNPTSASHDFNGDASADIVWRNRTTGANGYWYVDGEQYLGSTPFYAEPSRDWDIVASADFNRDQKMDLVWSHRTTGQSGIWFMDGVVRMYAEPMRTMEPGWSIEGAGDFDGDGKPDLLIRRARDGQLGIWYMDGSLYLRGALIPAEAGASWIVGGVGDFNGDQKPDIVLRSVQTGVIGVWLMNDTSRTGVQVFDNPGLAWSIVQVGDYDGDGDADLLWRNATTGANGIWLMDGAAFSRAVSLPSVPGTEWEVK